MGQVLFNAELDAVADTLPRFDNTLADMSPELREQMADFQRNLVLNSPHYTLKKPPLLDHPYVYSNETGAVLADNLRAQSDWVRSLFRWGPVSMAGKFVSAMFKPRRWSVASDAAKQEMYNRLLNKGATVAEVNGFMDALRIEASTQRIGGAKIQRSYDAMYPSVYEDIATGAKIVSEDGAKHVFRGFSPEVIEAVGKGNFWKEIDLASSNWWRNIRDAAYASGPRGAVGRMLTAAYPKGMGIRHYGKIWYHAFRFLTDIRWWAMNKAEADILLGVKYGVLARGAKNYNPSRAAAMHMIEGHDPQLALDAMISGWYDNRSLLGPMAKAFDAEAPKTVQRFLDDLPEQHEITRLMVERFGRDTKKSWSQQLIDDAYSFDIKGVKETVTEQASKMFSADEYDILDRSGVLQKVWELNEQTWADVQRTLRGNPNRSVMERMLNSYWLYWPISYQLKAGKWLYDTLTHKMFGKTTNFGGAREITHILDQHEENLKNDPDYVAMWDDNPETWFFAQMFLPITPFDMGVSLSRVGRVVGGVAGAWETPEWGKNPIEFASKLTAMGPVFTYEMLNRVSREQDPLDFILRPFQPQAETASTGTTPSAFRWGH